MANLQAVNGQSAKAEEIALLHKMAALAQPGSYLSSLFSEKMVAHIERQITDDMDCDLYAGYEYYMQQENEARGTLNQAVKDAEDKAFGEIDSLTKRVAALTRDLELAREQAKANAEDANEAWTKFSAERAETDRLLNELQGYIERVEDLEKEVMRRKAQVLDLREKIEAMAR